MFKLYKGKRKVCTKPNTTQKENDFASKNTFLCVASESLLLAPFIFRPKIGKKKFWHLTKSVCLLRSEDVR